MRLVTSYLLGLSGLVGIAATARFLSYDSSAPRDVEFDLGPADAFGVNTTTRVESVPALVIRNSDGFTALSLLCTHLGCVVQESQAGFECPCHGSRYDGAGSVLRGPAKEALHRLRTVVTDGGRLLVYSE